MICQDVSKLTPHFNRPSSLYQSGFVLLNKATPNHNGSINIIGSFCNHIWSWTKSLVDSLTHNRMLFTVRQIKRGLIFKQNLQSSAVNLKCFLHHFTLRSLGCSYISSFLSGDLALIPTVFKK